jgi:hypothetical protein
MNMEIAATSERTPYATIANITEQCYAAHRTYGTFQIAGCTQGEDCALTRITPRTAIMDYGDKRTLPLAITAREIADDLCLEVNSDAGERSFLGVFVCAGSAPTEQELSGARKRLNDFYQALVDAADREWERTHSVLFINDLQRRAAASLGLEKEWYTRTPAYAGECPGCGERVKPGVAVCRVCGAILDREKAASLGLAQEAPPAVNSVERHQARKA